MASIFVRFFDWTLPFGWCGLGEAGSDVQLLQSNACEHAPSDGVRREDVCILQAASLISSSVCSPSFKWLLLLAVGIELRVCEGVASSAWTLRLLWKRDFFRL